MRIVDDSAIRRHASVRFRSEYDYAVFEYWRSAKVLAYLENAGITRFDRVLDDGCGGGGMCVSFAEEARWVVGIEPGDRFRDVGLRLAAEKGVTNVRFTHADGTALPFRDGAFDLVLSHSVIEHVANPLEYLKEARRVLAPGGAMLLNTAPYLSSSGSHLPKYKLPFPLPLHLIVGRKAAFAAASWVGRHKPHWFDAESQSSSFVTAPTWRDEARRSSVSCDGSKPSRPYSRGGIEAETRRPRNQQARHPQSARADRAVDSGDSADSRHPGHQHGISPRSRR